MRKPTSWVMPDSIREISDKALDATKDVSGVVFDTVKTKSIDGYQQVIDDQKPLSTENWFERTAEACEALSDAIMGNPGWTNRLIGVASSKLGAIGVPASLLSVAALVGTASTGTAIGTLSGAAYTSAALAWIGGSVAIGTTIVASAGVAGMVAVPFLVKPLTKNYLTGKTRNPNELSSVETDVVNACCALALGLRQAARDGSKLDGRHAEALHNDALVPLLDKSADVLWAAQQFPILQRRRYNGAFLAISLSKGFAKELASNQEPIVIGLGTALVLNLLSEGEHVFSDAELDILDAIWRSNGELGNASNEEIAIHVQKMSPEQLVGFKNNVKRIAHEIRYARLENEDGGSFKVELFDQTNNAGADVKLINLDSGEVTELQLKASAYASYIESHFSEHPEIEVLATSEISDAAGVGTTGISNEKLEDDLGSVLQKIEAGMDPEIAESMVLAGVVTLARNVKVVLTAGSGSQNTDKRLIQNSVKAGLAAGLAQLLV